MNIKWVEKTGAYQNGEELFLGKIAVGYCDYNSCMSRADDEEKSRAHRYMGALYLPSFNARFYGPTDAAVRAEVERRVKIWFEEVNK